MSNFNLSKNVGVDNPRAKLTDADVRVIKYLFKCGYSIREVGEMFKNKCSVYTIGAIHSGTNWLHVKPGDAVDYLEYITGELEKVEGDVTE